MLRLSKVADCPERITLRMTSAITARASTPVATAVSQSGHRKASATTNNPMITTAVGAEYSISRSVGGPRRSGRSPRARKNT